MTLAGAGEDGCLPSVIRKSRITAPSPASLREFRKAAYPQVYGNSQPFAAVRNGRPRTQFCGQPSATILKGSDSLRGPFSCLKSRRHSVFWLPVQRVVNHAPITSLVAKKHHRLAFASDAGGVWRLSRGHRCDRSRVQEAGGPAESGAKRGDPAATATGPPTTHETPRDDGI